MSGKIGRVGDREVFGIVLNNEKDHGAIASGTENFSAYFTKHSYSTTGSHTWTFSDFEIKRPEILIEIEVTSGTPTITLPNSSPTKTAIASDSAQTLSAMAAGNYFAWVERAPKNSTYDLFVYVGQNE
jgi:hypothetical protein